jgi:hypothetical protein
MGWVKIPAQARGFIDFDPKNFREKNFPTDRNNPTDETDLSSVGKNQGLEPQM